MLLNTGDRRGFLRNEWRILSSYITNSVSTYLVRSLGEASTLWLLTFSVLGDLLRGFRKTEGRICLIVLPNYRVVITREGSLEST